MPFGDRSFEFKLALMALWGWPYLFLALRTRDSKRWAKELLGSARVIVMFSISFILLFLFFVPYRNIFQFHMPITDVLRNALLFTLVAINGLAPLLIALFFYRIIDARCPDSGAIIFPALLVVPLHILYLFDMVATAFNYGL